MNGSLCDEPSDAELRYAIATRHSMQRRVSVRTRAIVDFDLGAAPLNAGSSVVHIMMENKGQVQAEWWVLFPATFTTYMHCTCIDVPIEMLFVHMHAHTRTHAHSHTHTHTHTHTLTHTHRAFQFPSDMHLEPEYWADNGQLDDVEKLELNILDNELFSVDPKRGSLEPGAVCTVVASFKHSHIGTSRLPVLLKINRGREILVR